MQGSWETVSGDGMLYTVKRSYSAKTSRPTGVGSQRSPGQSPLQDEPALPFTTIATTLALWIPR